MHFVDAKGILTGSGGYYGIMSTPDECFGFMQELPDKYPQMSIFDL